MNPVDLIVIAVAAARVARMLLVEDGPMAVFHRLRLAVGAYEGAYEDGIKRGSMAQLFNCPWCMTFWWSLVFVTAVLYCPPQIVVCYVLAASFVGGWLVKLTTS